MKANVCHFAKCVYHSHHFCYRHIFSLNLINPTVATTVGCTIYNTTIAEMLSSFLSFRACDFGTEKRIFAISGQCNQYLLFMEANGD